jgi:hypothetical protein
LPHIVIDTNMYYFFISVDYSSRCMLFIRILNLLEDLPRNNCRSRDLEIHLLYIEFHWFYQQLCLKGGEIISLGSSLTGETHYYLRHQ